MGRREHGIILFNKLGLSTMAALFCQTSPFPRQHLSRSSAPIARAAGGRTGLPAPQTASDARSCLGLLRYHPFGVNDSAATS